MEKGAPLGLPRLCVLWTAVLWEVCRCSAHANWMWLGIASFGVPEKLGCGNLPLNGHQKDLCKKKPYLLHSIREGARLGIRECQSQFRHERWNCLLSPDTVPALSTNPSSISISPAFSIFGYELSSGTKETAFIYAVMAAGLVHSMTHLCSTGNLTDCACDSMLQNSGSAREGWHWGGCSDDIQYGMWLSRKFLDGPTKHISRKDRNGLMVMNLHNNEAGRLAVAKLMSIDCRCHGISGSCALKTCWRTMSSFAKVGSFLKEKYENSIQISDRLRRKIRRKEKSQWNIPIQKEDLLYINRSPNYCMEDRKLGVFGTQGRKCNRTSAGPDGCNLLCCGRGYNTQVVRHVERCECKFVWCCYVRCRRCETVTDVHTCK